MVRLMMRSLIKRTERTRVKTTESQRRRGTNSTKTALITQRLRRQAVVPRLYMSVLSCED